jgi:hypothetical protein
VGVCGCGGRSLSPSPPPPSPPHSLQAEAVEYMKAHFGEYPPLTCRQRIWSWWHRRNPYIDLVGVPQMTVRFASVRFGTVRYSSVHTGTREGQGRRAGARAEPPLCVEACFRPRPRPPSALGHAVSRWVVLVTHVSRAAIGLIWQGSLPPPPHPSPHPAPAPHRTTSHTARPSLV